MIDHIEAPVVSYSTALMLAGLGYNPESLYVYQYVTSNPKEYKLTSYGSPKKNINLDSFTTIAAPTHYNACEWIRKEFHWIIVTEPINADKGFKWKYKLFKVEASGKVVGNLEVANPPRENLFATQIAAIEGGMEAVISIL